MIEIIVADRGRARFFTADSLSDRMASVRTLLNGDARKHENALASDSPGRVYNRAAGVHQSYGVRHELRDDSTRRFVSKIADSIASDLNRERYGGFILVAAPRFLSQLKGALPRAARAKLIGGIPKELTRHAPQVVSRYLQVARRDGTLGDARN